MSEQDPRPSWACMIPTCKSSVRRDGECWLCPDCKKKLEDRIKELQEEKTERIADLPFPVVRRTMAQAFRDDGSLRYAYVSNIAMLLHDSYGITDYAIRNKAAEEILTLIFES